MSGRDMAHRAAPDVDHDPRAPFRAIDWAVAVSIGLGIVCIVWAFLAGALTFGGQA